MCVSNNFIEHQAYKMSEKIRSNSVYKFVRVDTSEGNYFELNKIELCMDSNNLTGPNGHCLPLIKKVILEDKEGKCYSIEPNENGLKFAIGEISYREYTKLQKKETFNGIAGFFVSIGFISLLMVTFVKFVT